ncbi:MAG TPA: helix-turn-helix domain-containing protein [Pyrinomonadaceae bacterium]|jgi:AcrR family transcriptional regulator|nr:helix-turn-helix domain-containing protein [Pyrinomonadaceae bacterium]
MNNPFSERLGEAFDFATMAAIARRLGVPHATVRNYFGGRMPSPEVLIKIAGETNVSLNWLLTGSGEKFVRYDRPLDLGLVLEQKISQIVDAKLAERLGESRAVMPRPAATEFDVESAVRRLNDPERVMSEWFRHEGREYPQDFGVVFFQGWESFSPAEKLDAVRDARKVLDRTLRRT